MNWNDDEKALIKEALGVYLQLVTRQMPQEHVQSIAEILEGIVKKLDSDDNVEPGENKPVGISDEWFDNVCKICDKLAPSGCKDKVTEKFPGKCDPILHYEFDKKK